MDGVAAGGEVVEAPGLGPGPPPPQPGPVELQHPTDAPQRPPGRQRVVHDGQQLVLDIAWHPGGDRAQEAQGAFPGRATFSIDSSTTVACRRAFSARSAASSASSACRRGRPGADACRAAMAPSLATLRRVMIVPRSTPARAAASAEDHSPVSVLTQISYFCSADRNRFGRREDVGGVGVEPGTRASFSQARTPSQVWTEKPRILSR